MCGVTRRELAGLVALFLLTLPAVTPRIYSSDEVQYFSYLRSLWFDRDVSFENEYRYFYDRGVARTAGFEETFLRLETPAGRRVNFGTIGCALLWAPFYAAADLTTRVARAFGASTVRDGFSQPYIAAVAYGSASYGFLTILIAIGIARSITGHGILAGVAVWVGTPLLFYMYAAPPYSHACSAFAVALFTAVWLRVRRDWTPAGAALLGAAAALMAMVREQDAFFAVGPAADFAAAVAGLKACATRPVRSAGLQPCRRWSASAAAGIGAFLVCFTPQLLAYGALNGHFTPSRLVARKMTWSAPHALEVLLSPQHGFFIWTPLAILAIAGLAMLTYGGVRRGSDGGQTRVRPGSDGGQTGVRPGSDPDIRRIGACALLMVAMQVYVSGSVESWTVAGAFGQRRFVALTVLLVLGLAALQALSSKLAGTARAALALAAVLGIYWNVAMLALFGAGLMDRQRIELRRNAYDAFITLPRMAPQLLYRYFTERHSFYRTTPPEGR